MFKRPICLAALIVCGWGAPISAQEMRVSDVPVFEGATDVSYMKRRGDVRFNVAPDFRTVGEFYAKTLTRQQWRKSKRDNSQRSFWVQTFSKGNATLEVRVAARGAGSEVRLTPKGMMWAEDDQPTPKDLPYPDDADAFKYSDFIGSIEYQSQQDVKSLAKFLDTELVKRQWTKVSTDFDFDHFVRMKFTFDKSSLDVDIRKEDEGTTVAIRTKGMQWDGMKAEIARAEKKAKKAEEERERMEAEQETQRQAAELLAARERRKNRPQTEISELPKLPNEANVVMDGERFKLQHVIAYEVFQYGKLSTRIVATAKPLKQTTLIERLKKVGTEEYEEAISLSLPDPHVEVVLDENDKPQRINLRAGGTPGNGSNDELAGSAIVAGGRARGTVELAEPGEFFDKVYTAKISFDVPVLTNESEPAKRLANVEKLPNVGNLKIGAKTYKLNNAVAYDAMFFDDPMTFVVMSEKPLNTRNLTAALGKKAADDYFEFTPQVKLMIDADDNVKSVSIWAANMSFGGNPDLDEDVVVEDGRVRGMAKMKEPDEAFDKEYSFEISFDVNKLGRRVTMRTTPAGGLAADSFEGLPIPEGHDGIQAEGGPFRTVATTRIKQPLGKVVGFYRGELASGAWGDWSEDKSAPLNKGTVGEAAGSPQPADESSAKLSFSSSAGELIVQLKSADTGAKITLISRDAKAAKAQGFLPAAGKARLFIGNEMSRSAIVTINGQDYTIAAGAGARDPKSGINWEVAPGNYAVAIKRAGGQSQNVMIQADTTIGVIIDRSGRMNVVELY